MHSMQHYFSIYFLFFAIATFFRFANGNLSPCLEEELDGIHFRWLHDGLYSPQQISCVLRDKKKRFFAGLEFCT